jgi:glutamate N-acetyltransferase/amino-acid N-acetyltransferase
MSDGVESIEAGHPIAGVELGVATAGLKSGDKPDLVVMRLAAGSQTAAVFTRNAFHAAPVELARGHLGQRQPRVLLINSGCANAGTGPVGREEAEATCQRAGRACAVATVEVLPFSTGLIGQPLSQRSPMATIEAAIDAAAASAAPGRWYEAARAITTTDTWPKVASRRVRLSGGWVMVTGMSKGSGMIRPDMATMLGFVATDASVGREHLETMLRQAVDASFHCITVDGDTSTNDAVTVSATGASEVGIESSTDDARLRAAVTGVCVELAQAIVRDAEGASRFVEVRVSGGRDVAECRQVAFAVAHSPLVKTALFGGDPNWGRILAAVGRSGLDELDVGQIDIRLGGLPVVTGGTVAADYDEPRAAASVGEPEIEMDIDLGRGDAETRVWTSDLSYEYVRINADYHT